MVQCIHRRSRSAIVGVAMAAVVLVPWASAAGWESVQRLSPGQQLRVQTAASEVSGTFVRADASSLVIRSKTAEQSIAVNDVRRVRVADSSRRIRNGLVGTAIGLGAGIGIGFAICPHCANEGNGGKFVAPFAVVGAAAGALAFLSPPWRTIYRAR